MTDAISVYYFFYCRRGQHSWKLDYSLFEERIWPIWQRELLKQARNTVSLIPRALDLDTFTEPVKQARIIADKTNAVSKCA